MGLSPTSSQGGGGGGSGVASVAAADTSIVIGGTASAPTVATGTLDVIAAVHPPVAAVAMNGQKVTGGANGTVATDFATFGQLPLPDIAYDEVAVPVLVMAGPTTVVAGSSQVYLNKPIWMEFFCPQVSPTTTASSSLSMAFEEDGTTFLGNAGVGHGAVANGQSGVPVLLRRKHTPTAGTHTYSLVGFGVAAAGTFGAGDGVGLDQLPMYLRTYYVT